MSLYKINIQGRWGIIIGTSSKFIHHQHQRWISRSGKYKLKLLTLSILVGIIGGFGAIVFRMMIEGVNNILVVVPSEFISYKWAIVILAPTIGGLLVGALVYYGAPEAKGHGVPEIIYSVNLHDGKMRWRVPLIKILASAITIGSTGSAGREGPIAQIGGGFASVLASKMNLDKDEAKTLVISGVSAGIAATFDAPLGGVLFGYEVIRRDRKTFSIFPLIVSSVVGTTIGEIFLGTEPAFSFPKYGDYAIISNIYLFILLGILLGFLSYIWVKGFYFIEELLERIPISPILLAGIGGLGVGLIQLIVPEVNGISYQPIDNAFALEYAIPTLLLFIFAKILATALSIGSGGSGGIFAPTLFLGVMFGTAFGLFVQQYGLTNASVDIFSLLGMAALFAGVAKSPLTAIIMTSEMVNDFNLMIPLMFTVVTTWIVSNMLLKHDIYVIKLIKRGASFVPAVDVLEEILVSEIMISDPITVSPKDRIEHVLDLMFETNHTGFPVVEQGNKLFGIITEHDVDKALTGTDMKEWTVGEVCTTKLITINPDCFLSDVFIKFGREKVNRLPVVLKDTNELVGWITRSDIMRIYLQRKSRNIIDEIEEETLRGL